MRLATVEGGGPDGRLVVVSSDLTRAVPANGIAATLQDALDRWGDVQADLRGLCAALESKQAAGTVPFNGSLAPLPRAWQWLDGSAFESHTTLMSMLFGTEKIGGERPLMYQGMSNQFYGPTEDVPFPSEEDGIDFEGEFGVIVDQVPMGTSVDHAARHIRLIVQINDWSLRRLAPIEMKTGFGWVQAKPPCSVAPVAVTPDELGAAWRDGRVALPLVVEWNGRHFGAPNGRAMSYSFPELIAHAARTRHLCAGTIIGSGTVSNTNFREVGSSCIAERRAIELLDKGASETQFMAFGDIVRMEARGLDGTPLFGAIQQRVVPAARP
jgi:fumarylacetoacetate (FAA) hydrolase